ncbi:MAG: hypothetical protein H6704_27765 [Myxococcales bacterium]|nr:hypothetical protein [Myxococcales bacterium]
MRRSAQWLLSVGCVLSTPALAAPDTPCDDVALPAPVEALRARLAGTDSRVAWATLAQDAGQVAGTLPPGEARACAHYLAGSAHFFLSAALAERRRHAADAVRHLVAAQAMAPDAMDATQPRARLSTAWSRMGKVGDWFTGARPVKVTLEGAERATGVVLRPRAPDGWSEACGATPTCRGAVRIALPPPADRPIGLRPGRWAVEVEGRCGARAADLDVPDAGGVLTLPPAAPCAITLEARDGEAPVTDLALWADGRPIAPTELTAAAGAVTVRAPGYRPAKVTLPPAGGTVTVALERCAVDLQVRTIPADATVEGGGPAPWGARAIAARRPDLGRVRATVDVPRPADCKGATHEAELVLPRPVTVQARDPDGDPVVVARLKVQGKPVDALGFSQPPGAYGFQAEHPRWGMAVGRFTVDPCPPSGDCRPTPLVIDFPEPSGGGAPTGALVTMGVGGAVAVGGLIAGATALSSQRALDDYENKRQAGVALDDLVTERDDRAAAADALLLTGGVVLTAGLVWWWLGGGD